MRWRIEPRVALRFGTIPVAAVRKQAGERAARRRHADAILVADATPRHVRRNAFFLQVLDEDMRHMESIQASIESGGFAGLNLSHEERRIYWMQEYLDRVRDLEELPQGTALVPMMESRIEAELTRMAPSERACQTVSLHVQSR
jgi:hypothetical protein